MTAPRPAAVTVASVSASHGGAPYRQGTQRWKTAVMGHVHKNDAALQAMAEGDPTQPVVMLNLLKYRAMAETGHGVDGMSGREAYETYGRAFAELNPRFGGEPIWMGRGHHPIIGDDEWDIVILVRYPTRKQFVDMFNDPDYQAIAPMRAAALEDSRILETTQLLPKGVRSGLRST